MNKYFLPSSTLTLALAWLVSNLLFALPVSAQVIITEIDPVADQVELTNIGNDVINMQNWEVWDGIDRTRFVRSLATDCGDFVLTPGEITVFTTTFDIPERTGNIFLQNATISPIQRTQFLQWGGVQPLVTLATSTGIWDDFMDFIPSPTDGQSIELVNVFERAHSRGFLLQANPTLCSENTACSFRFVSWELDQCYDNGTPSDPTDDYFDFLLGVEGQNLPPVLDLRPNVGSISPTTLRTDCSNCYFTTSPGTATGQPYELRIQAEACDTALVFTAPSSCSSTCEITHYQILDQICDNNATPANPNDDFFEFFLRVWGLNLSDEGYFVRFPDGSTLGPFPYDVSQPLSTFGRVFAGTGDFELIVEDAEDSSCVLVLPITDLGTCSPDCIINTADFQNVQCHDNGTSSNPRDDYLTFDVDLRGNNLSERYRIRSPQVSISPATGQTNTVSSFRTEPGIDEIDAVMIDLEDFNDDNCAINGTLVNPGSCSEDCILNIDSLSISCHTNGTPGQRNDDYFELWLRVTSINTSSHYQASIQPFAAAPLTLLYDSLYHFTTPVGSAVTLSNYGFTFQDAELACTSVTLNGNFIYDCDNNTTNTIMVTARQQVKLFPNPASNQVQLAWTVGSPQQPIYYQVWDSRGQSLLGAAQQWLPGQMLFVQDWPAGLYLLRLHWETQTQWVHLVVE